MRDSIKNPDHFLSVDCYMSLDVNYAVKLAQRCIDEKVDIKWWEEVLSPDDVAGHKLLKERMPTVTWTTGAFSCWVGYEAGGRLILECIC